MNTTNPYFSEYNAYSLENLLREYLANPSDQTSCSKIIQVIDSAVSFQNGELKSNNYITPSEAFSLVKNAINLTDIHYSLNILKNIFITESQDGANLKFVSSLLEVLTSSVFFENNLTNSFFSKGKLC